MTKAEYQKYLRSEHWRSFRSAVLSERSTCEQCRLPRLSSLFFYGTDLDLHHLTYERLGHEEQRDVKVLCRACHEIAEIPRRISKGKTLGFLGCPDVVVPCPECGSDLFFSIPEIRGAHRGRSWEDGGNYLVGQPEVSGCDCVEGVDANEFIASNFDFLKEAAA